MSDRMKWLNGWPLINSGAGVLIGATIHCAACGLARGAACVVYDSRLLIPPKAPEWPFNEKDCPLCGGLSRDANQNSLSITVRALMRVRDGGSTPDKRPVTGAAKIAQEALEKLGIGYGEITG